MINYKTNFYKLNYFILFFIIYLTLKELQIFAFKEPIFFSKQIYFSLLEYFFIIITYIVFFKSNDTLVNNKKFFIFLKIFFLYNILIIFYGLIKSNSYWDYKFIFVTYLPFLFFIFAFFFALVESYFKFIIKLYLNFIFPLSILFFFIGTNSIDEFTSRLALPISLFLIFFPYLKFIDKIILVFLCVLILFFDQTVRTHSLYILLSFIIISFNFLKFNNLKFYKSFLFFIIILPFFLFILFLFFKIDIFDYISSNYNSTNSELYANTRSFLYLEVFSSINSFFSYIFGSGANATYISDAFRFDDFIYEHGRYGTEVGFLNIILKSGFLGFLFFSLLIFQPIFFSLKNAKNTLSKLLSLKLATYWLVLFVEQPQYIGLGYFFIFLNIGILLSSKFNNLKDNEIKNFIY